MSHRPTTVADLADFSVLIDARSPAEYASGHICQRYQLPGAGRRRTRRIVGHDLSMQTSAAQGRARSAGRWCANIAQHLDELFRDKPKGLAYRSSTAGGVACAARGFVNWRCGWWAGMPQQLRRRLQGLAGACDPEQIAVKAPQLQLRSGVRPTGSAKTRAAGPAAQGRQVLDLEDLAAPGLSAGARAKAAAAPAKEL